MKTIRDTYRQVDANIERWARIVKIGPRVGPVTVLHLEIHHGQAPPHVESAYTRIPRGLTPQVGQDVAYRSFTSSGSEGHDVITYQVIWDRPPQYGSAGKVQGAFTDQALSHAAAGATGQDSERERKLLIARNMLAKGVISQADYDGMISAL